MINRYELVSRHNPILEEVNLLSPLTVGNGDFAYTVDATGLQTLYKEYKEQDVPLCTMSNWGWHRTPANEKQPIYTMHDLEMTEYDYLGRKVTYAVEMKPGNEEVYNWLRHNPHRMNLGRIGLLWKGEEISQEEITQIHQELRLYEGIIESQFEIYGHSCKVLTACDDQEATLGIYIESAALQKGLLSVVLDFPYGATSISGSDWEAVDKHKTTLNQASEKELILQRQLDEMNYSVYVTSHVPIASRMTKPHRIEVSSHGAGTLDLAINFSPQESDKTRNGESVREASKKAWKAFWEKGGVIELYKSKDPRALELERRIVLSQYLMAIQSCGCMPPQETGLTCNSWYGKFHLEMHLWHGGHLPLWNRAELLERSLPWYKQHLKEAQANAARNGYKGARWPKMVAYDGIDSPSTIATLLIWQQPHILYMLELIYQSKQDKKLLEEYWEVVKETADFMVDFAVYNPHTKRYDLCPPIIPAQEEHEPTHTLNPTFEVEYWSFTLKIAASWAQRLDYPADKWQEVAEHMAELPVREGIYMAHENCPNTFEAFNKDHPSMLGAFGLIASERVEPSYMRNTLQKVLASWDFSSMWGWDFAMMAMTAVRLSEPDKAIDILLKETPKNCYVESGNNFQKLRRDLPLYLPGNGALLLALPLMVAGYRGCKEELPGFPKNGLWEVEFEDINAYPY